MKHTEGSFLGVGGETLFWQSWKPAKKAKAHVSVVHGYGEHSSRYGNLAEALTAAGFHVSTYDLRGFGRSGGQRGFIRSWNEFRGDLGVFLEHRFEEHTDIPHFLYGHSMGGLMSLDYAMRFPQGLKGTVISAPALGIPNIAPILFTISRVLSKVWPNFSMDTGLDYGSISRDPEVVRFCEVDPLRNRFGTARLGTELEATRTWVLSNGKSLEIPLFLFHGTGDKLVPYHATKEFFATVGATDKTLKLYEGMYHEGIHDLNRAEVLADITAWLEKHV